MKIVWLSHYIPYPPRGGSFQRTLNLIRCASKAHEVYLVAINLQQESAGRVAEYSRELSRFCAGIEIWDPPFAWKGARWWAQLGFNPLYRHHHAARSLWSEKLNQRWSEVLTAHREALLCIETIDLARYFPVTRSHRKVLTHQNCESTMAERRAQNEPNYLKKAYLFNQARKLAQTEREWCPKFDVNMTVSELDSQMLSSRVRGGHFHVVENGTDTGFFVPSATEPEPHSIVFAASLRWYPNVSAIRFFVREIWPLLKRREPRLRLYLAGRNPVEVIKRYAAEDPMITLTADPEDIRPWVARGSVFICPVLDGGGTRLKILDALAMGKAVVSTTIGCEGIQVTPGEDILVADSPHEFSQQVLRVLGDPALRKRLGAKGRALVQKLYSWEVIAGHLNEAFACAQLPNSCPRRAQERPPSRTAADSG